MPQPPWSNPSGVRAVVEQWQASGAVKRCFTAERSIPPADPSYGAIPESLPQRLRQALPAVYHRNGAVYACRRSLIEERGTLLGGVVRPYMMPRERSINVDDEVDLGLAELLLRRRGEPAAAGVSTAGDGDR